LWSDSVDVTLRGGDLGYPAGEEVALGGVVAQLQRVPIGSRRRRCPAEAAQQVGLGRGQVAVARQPPVLLQLGDLGQRRLRPIHHRANDRPVQRDQR
jgi:hypothetical protein